MPVLPFALLLLAVITAAGLTVWALSMGGATAMLIALPVFMSATVALKVLRE